MTNYNAYIDAAGITASQFTRTIREQFPKFSKIQKSMVCSPERYGVQLLPEAEAALIAAHGKAPGLACDPVKAEPEAPPKPKPARTKPNRLVVYLPDETNDKLRGLMKRRGYATVQEFLCTILTNLVRIEEQRKEKPDEN